MQKVGPILRDWRVPLFTHWRKQFPEHIRRGMLGELAAKKYLQRAGMKFLTANFRSEHGEIDLVFRDPGVQWQSSCGGVEKPGMAMDGIWNRLRKRLSINKIKFLRNQTDCLVFVEVKTRSSEDWVRPAAAVDAEKRRCLSRAALDYLRRLGRPRIKTRFDIVEVLLEDGVVREVRHLPDAFALEAPWRYG